MRRPALVLGAMAVLVCGLLMADDALLEHLTRQRSFIQSEIDRLSEDGTAESEPMPEPAPARGRLGPEDLKYVGAFRLPRTSGNSDDGKTFSYGGGSAAVRPSTNTFWCTGHTYQKLHAEVTIPEPVISDVMADLPIAEFVQPFGDLSGGVLAKVKAEEIHDMGLGGLTFIGQGEAERALYGFLSYYDASNKAVSTHGISRPSTTDPKSQGPFRLGPLNPGYYGGYMIHVPPEWQAKGLKPLVCGASQLAIITRTSTGPAAHGFDPADFGTVDPLPAETYLNYPEGDTRFSGPGTRYNDGVKASGGAFLPNGLVFVGRMPVGKTWYGSGSTKVIDGVEYRDPCSAAQGVHAEGYRLGLLFYDPSDLLRVKRGELKPWEPRPYAVHVLDDHPTLREDCVSGSGQFDPVRKRLYVVQSKGERVGNYGRYPLVHVYEVK